MKFLLWIFLTIGVISFAQEKPVRHFTFLYKISNEEAKALHFEKPDLISSDYFHTKITSFPSDSIFKISLGVGHYIRVKLVENKIIAEVESINNLDIVMTKNGRSMIVKFKNKKGQFIQSVQVLAGRKIINYQANLKGFKIPVGHAYISIHYEGHTNFFSLDMITSNSIRVHGSFLYNFLNEPLRYIPHAVNHRKFILPDIYYPFQKDLGIQPSPSRLPSF